MWKNPGDTARHQIDYIIIKQKYRNQVNQCKAYPDADVKWPQLSRNRNKT